MVHFIGLQRENGKNRDERGGVMTSVLMFLLNTAAIMQILNFSANSEDEE